MTGILTRSGNLDADTQGEHHVKLKEEAGVISSKPSEARREIWHNFLFQEELNPANNLISDFWPPERRNKLFLFF